MKHSSIKNKLENKKAGMHISILLLVFAILFLIVYALFVFNIRNDKINKDISSVKELEGSYIKAEIFNFYLRDICFKMKDKLDPVSDFKKQLDAYKNPDGSYVFVHFKQIENQFDSNHIKIEDGNKLSVSFDISLMDIASFYQPKILEIILLKNPSLSGIDKSYYQYKFKCERVLT
jgi:hypothetical protein